MTPDEFLSAMNAVEDHYPVGEWRIGGVQAWPVVRNRSLRFNEEARARPAGASDPLSAPGRHRRAAMRVARGASRAIGANVRDREHRVPRRPGGADILVMGDAVSRVAVDDVWYDRFCDPVVEAAARLGLRTVQLDPHHHYRTPRAHPSRYVQPGLDVIDLVTRLAPARASLVGEGFADGLAELSAAGIPAAALDVQAVTREVLHIDRAARRLGGFFRSTRPRLAIQVDYSTPALAFTLAARRYGVPAVEIQHAIPPATHPMYARWHATPSGGYELLPTHYWTWTEEAAAVLCQWAAAVPQGPHVFVGGSPWLERWLAGEADQVRAYDARLAAERSRRGDLRQVLLTFEATFSSDEVIGPILDAAAATADAVHWQYRFHPTTTDAEVAHLRRALAARGLAVAGADVSRTPLYALLRQADVHVTHASSTTQEAALFGVPTVLTAHHAAEVYPDLVRRAWAVVATTADEIARAVLSVVPPAEPVRGPAPPSVEETLTRLLSAAPARR